jgi:predicted ATP-dependent serine protease
LRPAAQAERRLAECAKLGLKVVVAPPEAETLSKAIAAGLG